MTERVLGPTGGRRRKRLALLVPFAILAALILALGANANLTGSPFEGNDGNLLVGTAGNQDWAGTGTGAPPHLSATADLLSGANDNSFGQGTSENDVNVTVVTGSIPNSKADLARFAVAGDTIAGQSFLYLAWTRENDSGSVNYDFELNAATQPNLTTPGPKHLNRTVNDLNISYAFQGNNLTPTLTYRQWTGTAWGDEHALAGCSEGLGNSGTISDILGGPATPRTQGRFGEAAINLTCAGIVQANTCEPFSSAYVKSRASQSFQSEVKDFIAPVTLSLSSCGTVEIIKETNPAGLNQDFGFTATGLAAPLTYNLNDGSDSTDSRLYTAVPEGTYTVSEDSPVPAGFAFNHATCTGGGADTSVTNQTATIGLDPGENIVCTFYNDQQLGAIKVSKASIKGNTALAGAQFTVTGPNNFSTTITTDGSGTACVDNLAFGLYSVTETGAPPGGYFIDDSSAHPVTVNVNQGCSAATVPLALQFTDTPKTDIAMQVNSQDDGPGGTMSTINCVKDNPAPTPDDPIASAVSAHDPSVSVQNLRPGTYVCTVVVDP